VPPRAWAVPALGAARPERLLPRLGGGLDYLLGLSNELPVEHDVGVLRFDLTKHVGLERIAADTYTTRRSEHVQDLGSLTLTISIEMHQVRGLVPAFVANHPQERHRVTYASALSRLGRTCERQPCHGL
jgi:hypothetical protein